MSFLSESIQKCISHFRGKLRLDKNQGAFFDILEHQYFLITLCFLFKLNIFASLLEKSPNFFRILRIVHPETFKRSFLRLKGVLQNSYHSNVVFGSFSTLRTISLFSFSYGLEVFRHRYSWRLVRKELKI